MEYLILKRSFFLLFNNNGGGGGIYRDEYTGIHGDEYIEERMMFVLYIYFSSFFQVEKSFYFAFVVFFQLTFHMNKKYIYCLGYKSIEF